jgi:hypothetical protein
LILVNNKAIFQNFILKKLIENLNFLCQGHIDMNLRIVPHDYVGQYETIVFHIDDGQYVVRVLLGDELIYSSCDCVRMHNPHNHGSNRYDVFQLWSHRQLFYENSPFCFNYEEFDEDEDSDISDEPRHEGESYSSREYDVLCIVL